MLLEADCLYVEIKGLPIGDGNHQVMLHREAHAGGVLVNRLIRASVHGEGSHLHRSRRAPVCETYMPLAR